MIKTTLKENLSPKNNESLQYPKSSIFQKSDNLKLELENMTLKGELDRLKEINLDLQRNNSSKEKTIDIIIDHINFSKSHFKHDFIYNFEQELFNLKKNKEYEKDIIFQYLIKNLEKFCHKLVKLKKSENYENENYENLTSNKNDNYIINSESDFKLNKENYKGNLLTESDSDFFLNKKNSFEIKTQTDLDSKNLLSLNSPLDFPKIPKDILSKTKINNIKESKILEYKNTMHFNSISISSIMLSDSSENKKSKNESFIYKNKKNFKVKKNGDNFKKKHYKDIKYLDEKDNSYISCLDNSIDFAMENMQKNIKKIQNNLKTDRSIKKKKKKNIKKSKDRKIKFDVENNFNFKNKKKAKKKSVKKLKTKRNLKSKSKLRKQNLKKKLKLKKKSEIKLINNLSKLGKLRKLRNLKSSKITDFSSTNRPLLNFTTDHNYESFFKTQENKRVSKFNKLTKRETSNNLEKRILRKIRSQDLFHKHISPTQNVKIKFKNK